MKRNNKGASTIEYAVVAGLLAAAVSVIASEKLTSTGIQTTMCIAAKHIQGQDGSNCGSTPAAPETPKLADASLPQYQPVWKMSGNVNHQLGNGDSSGLWLYNYATKTMDLSECYTGVCPYHYPIDDKNDSWKHLLLPPAYFS